MSVSEVSGFVANRERGYLNENSYFKGEGMVNKVSVSVEADICYIATTHFYNFIQ
jgi:hypothetical protein